MTDIATRVDTLKSAILYGRLAFAVAAHRSTGSRRRLEPGILLVDGVLAVGDAAFSGA